MDNEVTNSLRTQQLLTGARVGHPPSRFRYEGTRGGGESLVPSPYDTAVGGGGGA
jgi:hypothetical protein